MDVKTIAVVGAGKMGAMITLEAAMAGYRLILHDIFPESLLKGKASIESQIQRKVNKGELTEQELSLVLDRVSYTSEYEGLDSADLIMEAVVEDIKIKTETLSKLDEICKPEAIIVTNTSSLSISMLANTVKRQGRFAGMHFFISPSKLVEIVRGYYTEDETVKTAMDIGARMGKVCIEVRKDTPGFLANRIYTPLFLEAFRVYEEGLASKEDIDLAMENSYLPVGPFKLADIIGLDTLMNVFQYFTDELGPEWNPPQTVKRLVNAKRLGKKNGKGWYDYN